MCETSAGRTPRPPLACPATVPAAPGRRAVLRAALLLTGAALLAPDRAAALATTRVAPAPEALVVRPRSEWARDLPPRGPLEVEAPGDVRFLLVHHTASPNGYAAADVPGLLRGFYRYHTGPEKGWPDIAYNFLIDAYGGVWEGRAGSQEAPVRGSATGGSQGYALLCCYIGDFTATAPTPAAEAAMLALLARLADTYGVDTTPGAVARFESRGSNQHPAGSSVTTSTISTHRQMSQTSCPGDVVHAAVHSRYQVEVTALRALTSPPAPVPARSAPAASPAGSPSASPTASPADGPMVVEAPASPSAPPPLSPTPTRAAPRAPDGVAQAAPPAGPVGLTAAGGAVVAAAAAAEVARRRARRGTPPTLPSSDPVDRTE